MKKTIDTQIKSVTIYTDQALIIREAEIELSGAEKQLVIEGLPLSIQKDSVRTKGTGNISVKILGLQTEEVFSATSIEEKINQLNQEIQEIQNQQVKINDQLVSINLQRNLVQGLGEKYLKRFSSFQVQQEVKLEEINDLLGFIGNKDQDYASQIAEYKKEESELSKQLIVLRNRLQQVHSVDYRYNYSSYNIIIEIEPEKEGKLKLEISYLVNYASWTPLYDLRTNTTGENLNLTYFAQVNQKTGEDWQGVSLTLSTAKPSLGKLPSKLKPFYIEGMDVAQFATRGGHHQELHAQKRLSPEDEFLELEALFEDDNYAKTTLSLEDEEVIETEQVMAETSQVGGVVTFNLEHKCTVPSDNQPQKLTIYNTDYFCQTKHIAIPRLDTFAYLEANAVNPTDGATLLPGKANIFRDNTFIGTTELENIAPGQSFSVNLGIDEGIKITRNLVQREVELIGNYRRVNYSYRLKISNLLSRQTKLKIIEQLPVPRDEKINVRLHRTQPEIKLGDMGRLEWFLTLPPKGEKDAQQEIFYQSSTEYPVNLKIRYFS